MEASPGNGPPSAVRCQASHLRFADRREILVLAYRGAVGPGTRGADDARHMAADARLALAAFGGAALVFDLSRVAYAHGDGLLGLLHLDADPEAQPLPRTLVAGARSRDGLASLVPGAPLFDDVATAAAEAHRRAVALARGDDERSDAPRMYILVRAAVPLAFAVAAAAHASVVAYARFRDHGQTRAWLGGDLRKAICRVSDADFERARAIEGHVVIHEAALGGASVALAFRPRVVWPAWVGDLPLYK